MGPFGCMDSDDLSNNYNNVYCKSFEVDRFRDFVDQSVMQWIIDSALVQYIRLPCNCECFLVNYDSFLQLHNFYTSNDLQYRVSCLDCYCSPTVHSILIILKAFFSLQITCSWTRCNVTIKQNQLSCVAVSLHVCMFEYHIY